MIWKDISIALLKEYAALMSIPPISILYQPTQRKVDWFTSIWKRLQKKKLSYKLMRWFR